MFIGVGTTVPEISNLPGVSRPGRPGVGLESIANNFSMQFNGVDEVFNTGLNLSFSSVPNFSISYWIRTTATFTNYQSYFAIGVNVSYNAGAFNYSAGRLNYGTTELVVAVQGNGSASGTTALNDGQWHHVVQVYTDNGNNTQRVRIYVDGNTTPEVDLASTLSYAPLTSDLFIGARNASADKAFPGFIDEVGVFDYELQTSDIENIYNITNDDPTQAADLSTLSTPPIAWYRMGD